MQKQQSEKKSSTSRMPQDHFDQIFNQNQENKRPRSVTINKSQEEIYSFINDLTKFPKFMKDLKSVKILSPKLSHWTFLEDGKEVGWDCEIVEQKENQLIAWKTVGDGIFSQQGLIQLVKDPNGKGTVVHMRVVFEKALAQATNSLTKLIGQDSDTIAYINLRRLKALAETGEVPTTQGQPSGRDSDASNIH